MKYFDIHSHAQFSDYDEDREEVMKRALDAGVGVINVGTDKKTSEDAVVLAHKYPEGVYACIGLHPTELFCHSREDGNPVCEENFDYEFYKKLALDPKVVAIGECGLDFYHLDGDSKEKQIEIFRKHIELSLDVDKPLMLHIRDGSPDDESGRAYKEVLYILGEYKKTYGEKLRGNVHFFAGDLEISKKFLELGFTLSFTGVITYPKLKKYGAADYEEIIKNTPIEMIMSETDAPYVAPVTYRGKRNEPFYVIETTKKIAEIKDLDLEKTTEILVQNVKRVFGV